MSSPLLAVDIVLLLPPQIAEEMIALSNHLNDTYGEKNRLNTVDRIPHISLLMGVIREEDIERIKPLLDRLAQVALPLSLTMEGLASKSSSSAIELGETPALKELQANILKEVRPFLQDTVAPEMFFETPTETNLEWVRNYATNTHHPHITVGPVFEAETYTNLKSFTVSQLALAHLGLHCTCRRLLAVSTV